MKTILFIVNNGRISQNENGGASVYYSHLDLLFKLEYKIHLLVVLWNEKDIFDENYYSEVKNMVISIDFYKSINRSPSLNIKRIINALFYPAVFEYYFLNSENKLFLINFIKNKKITYVWTEWRWAALWANFSNLNIPIIYSHHDWEYKLAKLRKKRTLIEKFHTFQKKRVEINLVKKVRACVSGSKTETNEIIITSKKKALYLPTTYNSINITLLPNINPKIVHLGGMGTTANRKGLERFIDVCWNKIKNKIPNVELWVIGSTKQAPITLLNKFKDSQIICKGFVRNLETVLFPEDIHIIPWEYNTGTRTRVPVIFNNRQVLVATKASVEAFPEIKSEKNAILCNNLDDMSKEIIELYKNKNKIKKLSNAGKQLFLERFTPDNCKKELKYFLDNLI